MKKYWYLSFVAYLLVSVTQIVFAQRFPQGQCTAGVAQDKGGVLRGNFVEGGVKWSGNAKDWYNNARNAGFRVGNVPQPGAIVVWGANAASANGHVGVVTNQVNGRWQYKAMNDFDARTGKVVPGVWVTREIAHYPNRRNPVAPIGYIYYP